MSKEDSEKEVTTNLTDMNIDKSNQGKSKGKDNQGKGTGKDNQGKDNKGKDTSKGNIDIDAKYKDGDTLDINDIKWLTDDEKEGEKLLPVLDSRCRASKNILSFYLTELNGLNVIIKLVLLGLCVYTYTKKKLKNTYILILLVIIALHLLLHIMIIIASLPPFCDSSNFDWKPGKFFNESLCHIKYMVYYSDYFWFIDSVVPNILLVGLVLTILK